MPRPHRTNQGGLAYHVLNRANARLTIFKHEADYEAFERVLFEAVARTNMRMLSYCIMPNHWHLILWPWNDGDLSDCIRWLTVTHTQRWHAAHQTSGTGHLYQGRFKSFVIQNDQHLWRACRYVERNALRANLVEKAEKWRWGSAWYFSIGDPDGRLGAWPESRPDNWLDYINTPQTEHELEALRLSARRGNPYGGEHWAQRAVSTFDLASTIRSPGRPKKEKNDS